MKIRFTEICDDLEKKIRSGQVHGRLPGIIKLSHQYMAGQATIQKAVRMLERKGYVTNMGARGFFVRSINPTRPRYKLIGMIGVADYLLSGKPLDDLSEYFRTHVTKLELNRKMLLERPDLIVKFPVDGLILGSSTLTREVARLLRENGIPFVSLNMCEEIAGINWVSFSILPTLEATLKTLTRNGHSRIGYAMFRNDVYGFQSACLKVYSEVLAGIDPASRELFYAARTIDDVFQESGEEYEKRYGQEAAKYYSSLRDPPTALIINGLGTAQSFMEHVGYPDGKKPVVISCTEKGAVKENPRFGHIAFDRRKCVIEAFKTLMELLDNADAELTRKRIPVEFIEPRAAEEAALFRFGPNKQPTMKVVANE